MLEFFSCAEGSFKFHEDQHIIPVTTVDGAKSLSAILLDDEYFTVIQRNVVEKDGIFVISEMTLIPFKAKAYLEIKERGEDSKNWKKHRGDIINLAVNFLTEESREELSGGVRDHFVLFMSDLRKELTGDIIEGACNQKIPKETLLRLLDKTFLALE